MTKKLILFLLLAVFVSACQPDPRKQAEAYATESEADQQAADKEQMRRQGEELHRIKINELQAIAYEKQQAKNNLWHWGGIFGTIALCAALLATAVGYSWGAIGTGRATAQAALVRANLIYLDVKTRQYPLYLQYTGHGRFTMANPNTDSVRLLDTAHAPDRQLISAMGLTQALGALAQEAAKSNDPAGVATTSVPVINARATDSTLSVGANSKADYVMVGADDEG